MPTLAWACLYQHSPKSWVVPSNSFGDVFKLRRVSSYPTRIFTYHSPIAAISLSPPPTIVIANPLRNFQFHISHFSFPPPRHLRQKTTPNNRKNLQTKNLSPRSRGSNPSRSYCERSGIAVRVQRVVMPFYHFA